MPVSSLNRCRKRDGDNARRREISMTVGTVIATSVVLVRKAEDAPTGKTTLASSPRTPLTVPNTAPTMGSSRPDSSTARARINSEATMIGEPLLNSVQVD